MNEFLLLKQLIVWFQNKGYQINSHTDIIKIKYNDEDVHTLKEYLKNFKEINNKKFIVRCFTKKKLYSVSDFLIEEFISADDNDYRWSIANALFTIGDKTHINKYLQIVSERKYSSSRQMIIMLLGKIKSKEIKEALLSLLNDYDILPHVIKALNNNLDTEVYERIKKVVSDENKTKVFADLKLLKENDPNFKNVDINGFWRLIQKEADRILN